MLGMAIRVVEPGRANRDLPLGDRSRRTSSSCTTARGCSSSRGRTGRSRRWDFVHCPPGTTHAFAARRRRAVRPVVREVATVPEGTGPSRFSCADETAARLDASSPEDTQDNDISGRAVPAAPRETRYLGPGLLPDRAFFWTRRSRRVAARSRRFESVSAGQGGRPMLSSRAARHRRAGVLAVRAQHRLRRPVHRRRPATSPWQTASLRASAPAAAHCPALADTASTPTPWLVAQQRHRARR